MEINLAAIEARLNRARAKAAENNTEEVEDAIDDTEKLFKFGEEISEIARGLGKETTVEELVARATSVHLEVLAEVYEKAPEPAKPAIEKAIANSVTVRERVVEALRAKGTLVEIPEETPILKRVQEELKERVQVKTQEQVTNLKPEVPKPEASENRLEEKTQAREAIREAEEEAARIRAGVSEEDVALCAKAFGRFDALLSKAKTALAAENYQEAKILAEQAREAIEDVEETIKKLKEEARQTPGKVQTKSP